MKNRFLVISSVILIFLFLSTVSLFACSESDSTDRQRNQEDGGTSTDSVSNAGGSNDNDGSESSPLPTPTDYAAPGPFADAVMVTDTGPDGNYTMFRPGDSLGENGFKHPIVSWGNGIMTTPELYEQTLTLIATHGFVIIGSNNTRVEEPDLSAGLDWLVEQNSVAGELEGKLDTSREATVGYSWGGGASIDAASRPNVKCTVSLHGMPPRQPDAFSTMHSPLLLFTSTGDTFVSADQFVTPNFEKSTVQTFYATLDMEVSHLYILDVNGGALEERAPTIAWLRLWLYGEESAEKFFYGDDCVLCQSPWSYQRKNWP